MGGMCSAQVSSAPLYATGEATEPAREMQADEEVGAMAAARVGDAASPPPPDGEAASPPEPDNEEYHDDFEFLMYATPGERLTLTRETDDAPEPPAEFAALADRMAGAQEKDGKLTKAAIDSELSMVQNRANVRILTSYMSDAFPPLYKALIAERDEILAASLADAPGDRVVGVVGLAHVDGIERRLERAPAAASMTAAEAAEALVVVAGPR